MYAITNPDIDIAAHHVTMRATSLGPLTPVMVSEYDTWRDDVTDELHTDVITYVATVESLGYAMSAPSEVLVRFIDGPGAWMPRDAMVPVVMGPRTKYGMF